MSITRIAARYAKPLLEMAEEHNVLEKVKEDMINFTEICNSNRDFVLMLKSPIISHAKKASILKAIFDKKVNDLTSAFFDIVARKNRETLLPDIAREFVTQYTIKMGYQEATVTTTIALDSGMRKTFEQLVTDISGKKPMLKEKVNPDLVGGYILQLGDKRIDESLSGHLKDLKIKFQKETI